MELAIDSSTAIASLALSDQGKVVAELTWECGMRHTQELLPYLNDLLRQAGVSLGSVAGLAVARGPGSFNGLRVAMSTAKGLAFSLGVPLVGISTLEVEAYPHACAGLPVYPIHGAGRGEIATALYQSIERSWCRLEDEHITTIAELCSLVEGRSIFCGELSPAMIDQLMERLGERAVIPGPAARLRRAGYLAELGWRRLEARDFDDPASLQPLYLRKPPITQPKSKLVGK